MPVSNTEHQRIDNVSSDLISYGIQSLETIGLYCDALIVWLFWASVTMSVSLCDEVVIYNVLAILKSNLLEML